MFSGLLLLIGTTTCKRETLLIERASSLLTGPSGHISHNGVRSLVTTEVLTLVKNPVSKQGSCSSCFVSDQVGGHVVLNTVLLLSFSVFICLLPACWVWTRLGCVEPDCWRWRIKKKAASTGFELMAQSFHQKHQQHLLASFN